MNWRDQTVRGRRGRRTVGAEVRLKRNEGFAVEPGWQVILGQLGLVPGDVLRAAGLPLDLFRRSDARLETPAFFRFWLAVEQLVVDPAFPLIVTQAITGETFAPCLFSVLCSPDLFTGLERISLYKRLTCPVRLLQTEQPDGLLLTIEWTDTSVAPPSSLVAAELAYFVHVARLATQYRVVPLRVTTPRPLAAQGVLEAWMGCAISAGSELSLTYALDDVRRPFLTHNTPIWRVFEADLRRKLADLEREATTEERVRAVLLEGLPSGRCTVNDVCTALATSRRTLQRRLKEENTSFKTILQSTRVELASHYLTQTTMSSAEIGFLLGFDETSSFFRAFQAWTGLTPETARRQLA